MKVKAVFYVNDNKEINWGLIGNVVKGYCNYFSEDPYLMMSEETLDILNVPFDIIRDDIKEVLVARNLLNGKDFTGAVYTGKYKVFVDDDLPFGIVDVR